MKKIPLFIVLIPAVISLCSCVAVLAMKPAETGLVHDTAIFAVKNGMNASFFVKTDDGYILFDAGSNADKFAASLKDNGISAGEIKWIILSHSDYDHVASLPLFANAVIYMCRDELPMVNGTTRRNAFGRNTLPAGIDTNRIILLSDGQELDFGGTAVRCIAAPGHTPGSMMYLIGGKYLFTGDAFKISGGAIKVHPFTMDSKMSKQTIERLKDTVNGCSVVMTSHYGIMVN